jgi:hypothetical protein
LPISIWRKGLITLLAGGFIALPIWSLIGPGPFGWHIRQPAAWQAGLEAVAVCAVLYTALRWCRGWRRWLIIGVAGGLYARHHGIDGALVATYLYMEGIFALGGLLMIKLGQAPDADRSRPLVAGLVGVIAWSLVMWGASLIDLGSMTQLESLALIVLIPAVLLRGPRLARLIGREWSQVPQGSTAFQALMGTMLLVLFAKSSVTSDFDSNWYGLAADRVLVASGNVFRSEALVAPVHYYPKFIEVLQMPLAALGSIPAIVGLSIGCWVLTVCTSAQILREIGVRPAVRPAILALVATLPALANVAITAKGDALAAWLLSVALLAVLRYRRGAGAPWFWIAASAALLASQARLSNVPYAMALSLITLAVCVARIWLRGRAELRSLLTARSTLIFLASMTLVTVITARTYLLSGVPLIAPNEAVALFERWGMQVQFPVGLLPSSDMLVYLPPVKAAVSYLFDPRQYPLLQIYWTGNVWLFIPIAALLAGIRKNGRWRRTWPVAAMALLFFPMLLGNRFIEASGADGNYFITPILCSMLFAGFMLQQALDRADQTTFRLMLGILSAFASSAAAMCLVTGSWGPGIRPFDTRMDRPLMDTRERRSDAWTATGMHGIASILQREPADTRAIGDVGGEGFWLPIRYEPIDIIALTRKTAVPSTSATLDFIDRTQVAYLIVRTPEAGKFTEGNRILSTYSPLMLRTTVNQLDRQGRAHQLYMDDRYELWKVDPAAQIGTR